MCNIDQTPQKFKKSLLSTTAIIAGVLLISPNVSAAVGTPDYSWDYDTVIAGNVGKSTVVPGITNITVDGGNGAVESNASIYDGHIVNVLGDPNSTFTVFDNRADIQSTLDGNLNSNMNIVIIDKDGLFFGSNFNADVQGIVASTGDVLSADIMTGGPLLISNVDQGGDITLNGTITVADAGLAAFVAPNIVNNGIINAKLGRVQMGAAQSVTVDIYGDGLIELALSGELSDALIENNGDINAEGGFVQMSALAVKDTVDNIVNNTGIIDVSSVVVSGGKIILSGGDHGTVKNDGAIDTSIGGDVNISGERFVQNGFIEADGGDITIDNSGEFYAANANSLRTNGTGTIELNQSDDGLIQNAIDAIDNTGTGTNTINVAAGSYNEAVEADHDNLIMNGNNAGNSGYGLRLAESSISPNSPGIHITADNVVIDGFEIIGGDPGIFADGANDAVIKNNIVHDSTTHGVYVSNSSNVIVQGNNIYDIVNAGIFAENSANILIVGNDVDTAHTGIRVHGSDNAEIIGNYVDTITGTDRFADGIHVRGGSDVLIAENEIYNTNDEGIYVNSSLGHLVVVGNYIENAGVASSDIGSGIELISTKSSVEIAGNDIIGTHHAGILVKGTRSGDIEIRDNYVEDAGDDGIRASEGGNIFIAGNEVENSGDDGIEVRDAINPSVILGNDVTFSAVNGVNINNSNDAVVQGNNIYDIVNAGIFAENSANILIVGNDVDTAHTGIRVHGSDNAEIIGNYVDTITGTDRFADGIHVRGGSDVLIAENEIYNTNDEGIYVNSSLGHLVVVGNYIENAGVASSDIGSGIELISTKGSVEIAGNDIIGTHHAGILVKGTRSYAGNIDIIENYVADASDDGIRASEGGKIFIAENQVENSGNDGIEVRDATNSSVISGNEVTFSAVNGVNINNSNDAVVQDNMVLHTGASGIFAENSANILIGGYGIGDGNEIYDVHTAIRIHGSDNAEIIGNYVDTTTGTDRFSDGIHVRGGSDVLIAENEIHNINDDGIYVNSSLGMLTIEGNIIENIGLASTDIGNGIELMVTKGSAEIVGNNIVGTHHAGILVKATSPWAGTFEIRENYVENAGDDGIRVNHSKATVIANNEIWSSGNNGIRVNNMLDLTLLDNEINNSSAHGFYLSGADNGDVTFQGNTIIDSQLTGARFESGDIDMSDLANANTFQNTSGLPRVAMQFDEELGGNGLRIVGETLGTSVFDGYLPTDSYYVRFEDGSILDVASNPIVIDGADASFDGVIPSSFAGTILPAAQLNFIENRLYDADDAPIDGRGQIFAGLQEIAAPALAAFGVENVEDFLPKSAFQVDGGSSGAKLFIQGLPPVDGLPAPVALNNIEPAAGEKNPEELAKITPEAGGDQPQGRDVTCLGDAVGSIASGSVTYSFGGSFEDSIKGASACSNNI